MQNKDPKMWPGGKHISQEFHERMSDKEKWEKFKIRDESIRRLEFEKLMIERDQKAGKLIHHRLIDANREIEDHKKYLESETGLDYDELVKRGIR
ncbi:hypothetical protein HY969_01430 [Candidatus Kaiserbacteria bacterium]|nr:hypothetical protein [Candidatus Kaiserbacteria bacterium]